MRNTKLIITFMLVFLVGVIIIPFFMKGPDGKPVMTLAIVKARAHDVYQDIKVPYNKAKLLWFKVEKNVAAFTKADEVDNKKVKADETDNQLKVEGAEKIAQAPSQIYKWQDENGTWHYSDVPRRPLLKR